MTLRTGLKQCAWVAVMALGIGITGGATRAVAAPAPQEHHDVDYSKNKNYQMGMHDGQNDKMHNLDHSKKRHFKKDDDHDAYEAGYKAGHEGNHDEHH
jgi:hypothetical protein